MSNYPATYNFSLIKGSTWEIIVTLIGDNNRPINLSTSDFQAQIRDETGQKQFGDIIVAITEVVNGKIELSLDYLASQQLDVGTYFYDLVRIQTNTDNPDGTAGEADTREFVMRGMITVLPSYTPSFDA